jgi:hypothetical protein
MARSAVFRAIFQVPSKGPGIAHAPCALDRLPVVFGCAGRLRSVDLPATEVPFALTNDPAVGSNVSADVTH